MARGFAQRPVGVYDYSKNPDRKDPIQAHLWHRANNPVEVGITNMRWKVFCEGGNDDQLRVNLYCLDESRDGASHKMAKYQQKMTEYYNNRVKLKRVNIGDLVLRKVTPATKDLT